MTGGEKIISLMRQQGRSGAGKGLQLAEMKTDTECMIGELKINREDYLIASHLKLKEGDSVVVYKMNDTTYIILEKVV